VCDPYVWQVQASCAMGLVGVSDARGGRYKHDECEGREVQAW